jgi:hypothetical protein
MADFIVDKATADIFAERDSLNLSNEDFDRLYEFTVNRLDDNHPANSNSGKDIFDIFNEGFKLMCRDTKFVQNFKVSQG